MKSQEGRAIRLGPRLLRYVGVAYFFPLPPRQARLPLCLPAVGWARNFWLPRASVSLDLASIPLAGCGARFAFGRILRSSWEGKECGTNHYCSDAFHCRLLLIDPHLQQTRLSTQNRTDVGPFLHIAFHACCICELSLSAGDVVVCGSARTHRGASPREAEWARSML